MGVSKHKCQGEYLDPGEANCRLEKTAKQAADNL
jgi:hypothetical protein